MTIVLRARLREMRGRDHIRLNGTDRIVLCAIDVGFPGGVNDDVWRVSRKQFGNVFTMIERN